MKFLVLDEIDEFPFKPGEIFEPDYPDLYEWGVDLKEPDIRYIKPLDDDRLQVIGVNAEPIAWVKVTEILDFLLLLLVEYRDRDTSVINIQRWNKEEWAIKIIDDGLPNVVSEVVPEGHKLEKQSGVPVYSLEQYKELVE